MQNQQQPGSSHGAQSCPGSRGRPQSGRWRESSALLSRPRRPHSPQISRKAVPPPVSVVLASRSSQMRISTASASEPLVLLNILSCAVGSSGVSTAKIKLEDYNFGLLLAICKAACLILPANLWTGHPPPVLVQD